jgi:hypothetical protein
MHPKNLQFGEQFLDAGIIEVFHPTATVGGYDLKLLFIRLQQPRHKSTTPRLEMPQDPNFIGKSLGAFWAVVNLNDPTIESQIHRSPQSILNFQHKNAATLPGKEVANLAPLGKLVPRRRSDGLSFASTGSMIRMSIARDIFSHSTDKKKQPKLIQSSGCKKAGCREGPIFQ